MTRQHDIIVLGSGIAGSTTAMVLSRIGLDTLVVEKKNHPRFVIGESTIPTTTLLFNLLAADYDIPELSEVAHYLGLHENGCAAWPKQGFWYGVHRDHTPLDPRHEATLETLLLPNGPDVHMLRSDADAFLVSRLGRYGVAYEDRTDVVDFRADSDGVRLRLSGPGGEKDVRARYVVDTTGHASFLAKHFGMRDDVPRLRTNTRSIFGHFEGVPALDDVLAGHNPMFRFSRNGGTMHHCFRGGWIWVIPFDNGVTSVGFQLDRDVYPLEESVSPEEEMRRILDRYPSIAAHLGAMKPIRPLVRTDRVQFTSKTILGNGFILAPHAAAFIEPLFSTGIVLTLSFIARFAPLVREAKQAGDFSAARFRPIEQVFFDEVAQIDRIVNGTIQSFRDYDVFKQYWRNWVVATMAQFTMCVLGRGLTAQHPVLYGTGVPGFSQALEEMHALVCRPAEDDVALAAALHERVEPWYERLCLPALTTTSGEWSVGSSSGCAVHGGPPNVLAEWFMKLAGDFGSLGSHFRFENAVEWMSAIPPRIMSQVERYTRSRAEGTAFHRAFDRIIANQNPARFDYRKMLELG